MVESKPAGRGDPTSRAGNRKAEQVINSKRSFLRTYAVERGDGMRCPP